MISVEYYITDGHGQVLKWPAVIRRTLNGEVVISEEAVTSEEAELAGVPVNDFFTVYSNYISSYLESLTTYAEESALDQMDSHRNVESAVRYFNFFMAPVWQQPA
jgi:hypothetical protein